MSTCWNQSGILFFDHLRRTIEIHWHPLIIYTITVIYWYNNIMVYQGHVGAIHDIFSVLFKFFLVSGWGTLPEAMFATFGEGSALEPSDSHAFATFPLHCLVFRVLIRLQIHQNLILGLIYCLHQFCLFVWVQHGSTLHLACHAFVSVFTSAFHQAPKT